jgi:hypothetical protein
VTNIHPLWSQLCFIVNLKTGLVLQRFNLLWQCDNKGKNTLSILCDNTNWTVSEPFEYATKTSYFYMLREYVQRSNFDLYRLNMKRNETWTMNDSDEMTKPRPPQLVNAHTLSRLLCSWGVTTGQFIVIFSRVLYLLRNKPHEYVSAWKSHLMTQTWMKWIKIFRIWEIQRAWTRWADPTRTQGYLTDHAFTS